MEIDKAIFSFYESEIDNVNIPVPVIPERDPIDARERNYNIIFAGAIILACLPFAANLNTTSSLSLRAVEFTEYHNLETIIPAGLLKINELVYQSLNSGGKK